MTPLFILKSLIFSLLLLLVSAEQKEKCPLSFGCGYLGQISFPFTVTEYPHCGILAISGCNHKDPASHKTIQLGDKPSRRVLTVTYVDHDTITVTDEGQRKKLRSKDCQAFNNFTLPPNSPLAVFYIKYNITMFRCNHSLSVNLPKAFHKYTNCNGYNVYYDLQNTMKPPGSTVPSSLAPCTMFQVAIRDQATDNPFDFLSPEISIEVQLSDDCNKCLRHWGGQCQLDIHGKFHCAHGGEVVLTSGHSMFHKPPQRLLVTTNHPGDGQATEIQVLRDAVWGGKEPNLEPEDKPAGSSPKAQNNPANSVWSEPDTITSPARRRVGIGEEGEGFDEETLTEGPVRVVVAA